MTTNDLHNRPFDDGTLVKLTLFRSYIREWLPVFLAPRYPRWQQINIFDFFAGPGETALREKGTPAIILEELSPYAGQVTASQLNVSVVLNEFDRKKYELLRKQIVRPNYLSLTFTNLDFDNAFAQAQPKMKGAANLLLLDQYGLKHVNEAVLRSISGFPATDFLMFISSSIVRRFPEHPSIKKYISIPAEKMSALDYYHIHRAVTSYFESLIPKSRKFHLAPFSIKKGSNIYGLVFGSGHLLGLEKFLRCCWKIDPDCGEANFDIDDDRISATQPSLFRDFNTPKKIKLFETELEHELLTGKLTTKESIRHFALVRGFLPKHATNSVQKFKKSASVLKGL